MIYNDLHGYMNHMKDPGEEYPITSWALYIYIQYTCKTIKTKCSVRTGLDMFLVRYGSFPDTAMSGCKPSTLQVNSFPEILDLSDWFRHYECLV